MATFLRDRQDAIDAVKIDRERIAGRDVDF
jgi:hypothetical protein